MQREAAGTLARVPAARLRWGLQGQGRFGKVGSPSGRAGPPGLPHDGKVELRKWSDGKVGLAQDRPDHFFNQDRPCGLQGPQVGHAGWGSFMVNRTACPSWCELVMTGRLDEGLVGDPVGVNRTAWTFFPSCTAYRLRSNGRSGWQIQKQLPYRLSVHACRAGWAGWGSYEVNRTVRTARSWLVNLVGDLASEPYCLYCLCRAG